MVGRLSFLAVAAFWVTMNILLWRLEFGARGGDAEVPPQLVWHKILTAPDSSSLSVYQKDERMGYCEISTGVGQQMADFDEGKPPPEGFATRAGYQLHVAGNVSIGDFTNRIKFEGRMRFGRLHKWQELTFRIITRTAVVEISSAASNQWVHLKMSSEGATVLERDLTYADLENPGAMVRLIAGNGMSDFLGLMDTSEILAGQESQHMEWEARRTRTKIGTEAVPIYQLETSILGRPIVVDVGTLGEILRVDLPDEISARIDDWNKP